MNKYFYTIFAFAGINTRRFFRDRLAIFFTIIFPLIFLFVFGSIFRSTGNVSFRVALINQSSSKIATEFVKSASASKNFNINGKASDIETAKEKMKRSELDAVIVLPENFGQLVNSSTVPSGQAIIYYSENNIQAAQTLESVLQAQFKVINAKFVSTDMPFTVKLTSTKETSLTQFDYIFAGLMGFAIISLGIFGPVNVFPELKKQGILRRLHTTPLRVSQYFISSVMSQSVIGLVALSVMMFVSMLFFDLTMRGNYFTIIGFILLSIFTIYGIGLAIGGWAKNERQAAPLANLITFPMIFLSGTFFARFLMPEWLQSVSGYLPLTPVIDGIRLIVTEGKTVVDIMPQIGLLSAWAIVIYFIAFRIFRWE
jgi:ABC-2 type transport system permease protein